MARSKVWNHYYDSGHRHNGNATNWKVFCRYHIDAKATSIQKAELAAFMSHEFSASPRIQRRIVYSLIGRTTPFAADQNSYTEAELSGSNRDEELYADLAMASKTEDMWKHLTTCPYAGEALRLEARNEFDSRRHNRLVQLAEKRKSERQTPLPIPDPALERHWDRYFYKSPTARVPPTGNAGTYTNPTPAATPPPLTTEQRLAHNAMLVSKGIDPATSEPLVRSIGDIRPSQLQWTRQRVAYFAQQLCMLMIACSTAWWNVEHPFFIKFFEEWVPGVEIPGRREISGKILDSKVDEIKAKMEKEVNGRCGTGQCDGWKNVKKDSIVGTMMNVEYKPYILNTTTVSAEQKSGENLLQIVLAELVAAFTLGVSLVAWCTDCGGDAARMRRLLTQRLPWMISIDCWAHQINLVVGDVFKHCQFSFVPWIEDALTIIKWFNNHSFALGKLREGMIQNLGRVIVLILPVLTRWTSHYLAIARLRLLVDHLRHVRIWHKAAIMETVGAGDAAKQEAEYVFDKIGDDAFWNSLDETDRFLEPLAIAANIMQSDFARLDVVLITLFQLWHTYNDPSLDPAICAEIHKSLARRWLQQDQDVFVLAVILNPYLRTKCFASDSPFCAFVNIKQLVTRVYKRVFNTKESPNDNFIHALTEYVAGVGIYSDESLSLGYHQREAKRKNETVNLINIWRQAAPAGGARYPATIDDLGPPPQGASGLARLAQLLFSIVPNSGAVERLFSILGIVHSRLRNNLSQEKARKEVMIRREIAEQHPYGHRAKRRLVDTRPTQPPSLSSVPAAAVPELDASEVTGSDFREDFEILLEDLRREGQDVEEAEEAALAGALEEALEHCPSTAAARKDALLLHKLFKFPATWTPLANNLNTLQEFWEAGGRGRDAEVEFLEKMATAPAEPMDNENDMDIG